MTSKFKIRREALMTGGATVGSSGTYLTKVMAGSVSVTCPCSASTSRVATVDGTVTGLAAGDLIFMERTGSAPAEVLVVSTCVSAANTVEITVLNTGSTDAASSAGLTFNYIAVTRG